MILDKVNSPEDLKRLSLEELLLLAEEIRSEIIRVTAQNGGHLASSLGAVFPPVVVEKNYHFSVSLSKKAYSLLLPFLYGSRHMHCSRPVRPKHEPIINQQSSSEYGSCMIPEL